MCNIWTKDPSELSYQEFEKWSHSELLKNNLVSVNLTGGEPTLRKDILDVTNLFISQFKMLELITLNTNGIDTSKLKSTIINMCNTLKSAPGVKLNVFLSLDGDSNTHDKVRGVKGAYTYLMNTLDMLKTLKQSHAFDFSLNFTITSYNYLAVESAYNFCVENSINLDLTYNMYSESYFDNKAFIEGEVDSIDDEFIISFIESKLGDGVFLNSRSYYRNLIKMLRGSNRKIGCIFQKNGFFLNSNGDIYKCWASENSNGNIHDMDFDEIWSNSCQEKAIEDIKETCKSCYNNCYSKFSQDNAIRELIGAKL